MVLFLYHVSEFIKMNQQKNLKIILQILLNLFIKTGSMELIFLETDFQRSIVNQTPSEDAKKIILPTSDSGNEIQAELNLYRMDRKLYSASFRIKEPISNNAIRN